VDVNSADRETAAARAGPGREGVDRILQARRFKRLTWPTSAAVAGLDKLKPFLVTADWSAGRAHRPRRPAAVWRAPAEQLSLF
jgi:predicted DNA-binding helix-hairpin-helix protein